MSNQAFLNIPSAHELHMDLKENIDYENTEIFKMAQLYIEASSLDFMLKIKPGLVSKLLLMSQFMLIDLNHLGRMCH